MRFGQTTTPGALQPTPTAVYNAGGGTLQVTPTAIYNAQTGGGAGLVVQTGGGGGGGGFLTNIFGDVTRAGSSYLTGQQQAKAYSQAAAAKAAQTASYMPLIIIGAVVVGVMVLGKH